MSQQPVKDYASFFEKNRSLLLGGGIFLLLVIFGTVFFIQRQEQKRSEHNDLVYAFREQFFKPYQAAKEKKEDQRQTLLAEYQQLVEEVATEGNLTLLAVELAGQLHQEQKMQQALSILEQLPPLQQTQWKNIVWLNQVAILEDLADEASLQKAAALLEKLVQLSPVVMMEKNYLDLGRIYLKLGNRDKAKLNFSHLTKTYPDSEFARLGHSYLKDL